jgi:uncharacterized protein (DUF302 family)
MTSIATWILGLFGGAVLTAIFFVWVMRNKMIVRYRCPGSFDDTCAAIERVVPENAGWGFPIDTWNMMETLRNKGQVPQNVNRLHIFFICNPSLAKRVLAADPRMAGMMPCSWAVYEQSDGSVWITKLNIRLMKSFFGGAVGAAMGEVAEGDEIFLAEVLAVKPPTSEPATEAEAPSAEAPPAAPEESNGSDSGSEQS